MKKKALVRIAVLVVVLGGLWILSAVTGVAEHATVDNIRQFMAQAGPWGVLAFFVAFAAANFLQISGLLFVAASVVAYGEFAGGVVGFAGATLAVCFSFAMVRWIGGKPLSEVSQPLMRRWLDRLEERPVLSIIALRTLFVTNPYLNYALALSGVRFRDYLVGTVLGIVAPIAIFAFFVDQLLRFLS